jgi:hypothetical protein
LSKRSNLSTGKWLIFLDPVISLEKFFEDIHIPFECEFLVAEMLYRDDDEGTEVSLTEVYRVQPTQELQKYLVGNWSSGAGLAWSTVPFYQRRGDLHGLTVRAAIVADVGTGQCTSVSA